MIVDVEGGMTAVSVFLLVVTSASFLFALARKRTVRGLLKIAPIFLIIAMMIPDGALKWALIALGAVAALSGLAGVPGAVWRDHWLPISAGACSVVAIVVSEVVDLSGTTVLWVVGIPSTVFVTTVMISAVRLIRMGLNAHAKPTPR